MLRLLSGWDLPSYFLLLLLRYCNRLLLRNNLLHHRLLHMKLLKCLQIPMIRFDPRYYHLLSDLFLLMSVFRRFHTWLHQTDHYKLHFLLWYILRRLHCMQ